MGRSSETPALILRALWEDSPQSIRQISEATGKKESTIVYFAHQMVGDGRDATRASAQPRVDNAERRCVS